MNETNRNNVAAEPSPFVWYELHTPDAATAARFYAPVLGWSMQDAGLADRNYTLLCVDKTPVGGLLEKSATGFSGGEGARWMGYIGVDDAERYSKLVQQSGGVVHRAAEKIPGVGTFAVVADPRGAIFTLFQPLAGMTRPQQPAVCSPGMLAWHELVTTDLESAFRFYSGLFGWTRADALDMGPNGVYQMFAAGSGPIGGMMALPGSARGYGWFFCFHVEEIGAAMERVKQNGGVVLHGPSEVPGGRQVAHCQDTQGAFFAMVGPATK